MSKHPARKRRRRVTKFRINETSIVDRPAHAPARVAIMKRAGDNSGESMTDPELQKRLAMTSTEDGHAHLVVGVSSSTDGLAEVRAGSTSFDDGHSHSWLMDDAGNITIAEADGHTHGISLLIQKDLTPEDEAALASLLSKGNEASNKDADPVGISSEENMSKQENQVADETAAVQAKLDELQKRAERSDAVIALSPDQRQHYDVLKGEDQDEFLSKSSEQRDGILKNLQDADPVVYTSTDGREFRKSADSNFVVEVKRNDELQKKLAENEATTKRSDIEKRASDELGNLTGDIEAKADLLEAVDGIDVKKREAVMEILKSKDAGMELAFKQIGNKGSSETTSAEGVIEGIAKRIGEQDSKLTSAQAYNKALDTAEGQQAFAQLRR